MSNIYVQIPDVTGESTSANYSGQIECLGVGHGMVSPVRSTKPRYQGSTEHGPVVLYHRLDNASPALRNLALGGDSLDTNDEVTINVVSTIGGQQVVTETITLSGVKVESVELVTLVDQASGEPGNQLLEAFSLSYSQKIEWDKVSYNEDGNQSHRLAGAYDVADGSVPV